MISSSMLRSFEMCSCVRYVKDCLVDQFIDFFGCLFDISGAIGSHKYVCKRLCHLLTVLFLEGTKVVSYDMVDI